jgi:hypothetical protein
MSAARLPSTGSSSSDTNFTALEVGRVDRRIASEVTPPMASRPGDIDYWRGEACDP